MRRGLLLSLCLFLGGIAMADEVILECGQNSGNNFNGWAIPNYHLFDRVDFHENSIEFYREVGGNLPIIVSKKVDDLSEYLNLSILFNFQANYNAEVVMVTYYLSEDGINWVAVEESRNNKAVEISHYSDYTYVKAIANVLMEEDGSVSCDYFKLEGKRPALASNDSNSWLDDEKTAATFKVFPFRDFINIETQSEEVYQIQVTAISGKIIYRETQLGSTRIDLDNASKGIYIVTIIQNNQIVQSQKVAL